MVKLWKYATVGMFAIPIELDEMLPDTFRIAGECWLKNVLLSAF